ncbi:sigma-54-dependent Fis family transcriptional regulator [Geomonas sp. Red875]|uniref:Sigma-54-dependent Fis family transcriptional regulator n=1 Tax=Geomesophilobacter sediminis TaxID=2798584 RepID=A0A8J7JG29_9BACT|nr:sigma-54-dependent Fis family transcriptional regulator [Geomesophilobacter sediminis]
MGSQKDRTAEWTFFETVARAAFANPFGEIRDDLDVVIGGAAPGSSAEEILQAVVIRIEQRINEMQRKGKADLRRYEGSRRDVLRTVFLFHLFHRHTENFDRLIQAQLKGGDSPSRVSFAKEVLHGLGGFGFIEEEAVRFFAVFYQLRRAFYFIRNGLVGGSLSMRSLRKHLWDCVFTHDMRWFESRLWDRMEDFSVLLLGETGTGKGAAAAAIGRSGFIPFNPATNSFTESFTRNFIATNLSQYSEGVLESELFGHRKGAFTGAVENHEGLFSRCAPHGVIFLDEIGDVGAPVQIKLLQVLQERIFFPVGSHEAKRFSGRIVAATNRPLEDMLTAGKFREDFFYRLCSDVITLPTLRQRLQEEPAEMDNLLDSVLSRLAGEASDREKQLVKNALKRDVGPDYHWPGNVRELEQAVKRIILTGRYQVMKGEKQKQDAADWLVLRMKEGTLDAEGLLAGYCGLLYQHFSTYEDVSRRTDLDRRTAKKYVQMGLALLKAR